MACIEGHLGRCWVDSKLKPTCGIAIGADFCFLLGKVDGSTHLDDIEQILSKNSKHKVIVCEEASWRLLLEEHFPKTLKNFSRYSTYKNVDWDRNLLKGYIRDVQDQYTVKKIDKDLYITALEKDWTADLCCFYSTPEEFLDNGIGYVVLNNGEIISGASSYTYCQNNIDITIGTDVSYRRQGLALACASMLILDCINNNVYPRWDAVDLNSIALAEKLGYQLKEEYMVHSI